MALRTYHITGLAYSDLDNASVTVSFNGNNVFSGNIPVSGPLSSVDTLTGSEEVTNIITFTADASEVGILPISLSVTNGIVIVASIVADYTFNVTEEQFIVNDPTKNATDYANFQSGLAIEQQSTVSDSIGDLDYKTSITLDGNDVTATSNPEKGNNDTRGWWYTVPAGSTISWNHNLSNLPAL